MKTIPLYKVHINVEKALERLRTVLESGFINEGEQVTELSDGLMSLFSTQQLILLNSCTSAISLALELSNVGHDDYVISTPMTCVATNTPIVKQGAHIVWADIDPQKGTISVDSVNDLLSSNKKIKAVIGVDWAGMPIDLEELQHMCDSHGVKLIQDAAQAFGATYKNKPIHESSDFTCYSTQAIKHFTTGDGGILVCKDKKLWELSKQLKWFGIDRDVSKDVKGNWKGQHWDFDIENAGYKFNMNNIAAALGLSQLDEIENVVSLHRKNAKHYSSFFEKTEHITPIQEGVDRSSSYWTYTVLLDKMVNRDAVMKTLNDEGIMAGLMHVPNNLYTCFKQYQRELPGVKEFFDHQLSLPCGWWVHHDDVERIATRLIEVTQ